MATYTHDEYGLTYSLPDKPSVLDVLAYDSRRIELHGSPALLILWECAKEMIRDWKCDLFKLDVDLAKVDNLLIADAVKIVAFEVADFRANLRIDKLAEGGDKKGKN